MKKTYQIQGMHCVSCALNIEGELEDRGFRAKVNFAKASLEVEFDGQKTSEDQIKSILHSIGYSIIPL